MPNPLWLFDFDGTLVDSSEDFVRTMTQTLAHFDLPSLPAPVITQHISSGARAILRLAKPSISADLVEQCRDYFIAQYQSQACQAYEGIHSALALIKAQGSQWGIVTNKPKSLALLCLAQLDWQPSILIAPEDVSVVKPSPEGILKAIAALDSNASHTFYVGDHQKDVQAGNAANCTSVAVTWGFSGDNTDAHSWQADYVLNNTHELTQLIKKVPYEETCE